MLVKEIALEENVSDFSKFKKFEGLNRPINKGHVKTLAESFKKFGTASAKVVVIKTSVFGKTEYYIVDGQHTIQAVILSELTVNVIIVEMENETTFDVTQYIAVLNNAKKGWSSVNYLKAFVANNKYEYIIFNDLIKKYKFTITDLMHIFLGASNHDYFKQGTMEFKNYGDSMRLVKAFVKMREYLPKKAFCTRNLPRIMRRNGNTNYKPFVDAVIRMGKVGHKFSENEKEFVSEINQIMTMNYDMRKVA